MRKVLVCLFFVVAVQFPIDRAHPQNANQVYTPSVILESTDRVGDLSELQGQNDGLMLSLEPPPATSSMDPEEILESTFDAASVCVIQQSDPSDAWLTKEIDPPVSTSVPPDSVANVQSLTNANLNVLEEDPDTSPAIATWAEATSNDNDTEFDATFPFPSEGLQTGQNLQEIRLLVKRHNPGTGHEPTVRIRLFDNGNQVDMSDFFVVPDTATVLSWTWDAGDLVDPSLAAISVNVEGVRSGGNPSNRTAVDFGGIEWVALVRADNDREVRVSFDLPDYDLDGNSGMQEFRALLRPAGTGTPEYQFELWKTAEDPNDPSTLVRAGSRTVLAPDVVEEVLTPDAVIDAQNLSSDNLEGAIADIQESPDNTDYQWLTAPDGDADTYVHVSFPTPTRSLSIGSNLQQFRVRLREHVESGSYATATYMLQLWENGVPRTQSSPAAVSQYEVTETLKPDTVLTTTNFSPASPNGVAELDDTDSSWLVAVDGVADTGVEVSFPTPDLVLREDGDFQEIRVQLQDVPATGAYSTAEYTLKVYDGGSSSGTLVATQGPINISGTSAQVVSLMWDAADLVNDPTGASVTVVVDVTADDASGSTSGTINVGMIEWIAAAEDQGTVVSYTWSANSLYDTSGVDVELRIYGTADTCCSVPCQSRLDRIVV